MKSQDMWVLIGGIIALVILVIVIVRTERGRFTISKAKAEARQMIELHTISDTRRARLIQKKFADYIYDNAEHKDIEVEHIWKQLQELLDEEASPTKKPL